MSSERLLEDFEVLNVFVFIFCIELMLFLCSSDEITLTLLRLTSTGGLAWLHEWDGTIDTVENLTNSGALSTLLDLGEIKL